MELRHLYFKYIKFDGENKIYPYPLVLLRGLGRSSPFWLHFIEDAQKYTDVIVIDLLGTGKSKSWKGHLTISGYANDVLFTLLENKITQCSVLGLSMGGMVALQMAELAEKIKIMEIFVISSSSAGFKQERICKNSLFSLLPSLFKKLPENKKLVSCLVSENALKQNPDIVEKWDLLYRQEGFSRFGALCQLIAAFRFNVRHFKKNKLNMPLTFIAAKDDKLVPWNNSLILSQWFVESHLILFEEGGHDLAVSKRLNEFIPSLGV